MTATENTTTNELDLFELEDTQAPAPAAPQLSKPTQSADITQNSIVISLNFGRMGITRKLRKEQIEVDADKKLIAATKKLIDCPEYDEIVSLDGEIRNWIYSQTLKVSWLKDGMYLCPLVSVEMVDDQLTRYQAKRLGLVERFIRIYEQRRDEAAARLSAVFDSKDYPAPDQAARKFYMDWSYVTIGSPNAGMVSRDIYERERAKISQKWAAAADEVTMALRSAMAELVTHAAEKLTGERDNGKPKVFRDSAITNITDFLDTFRARNLTNDAELEALVLQARELLRGISPDDLRKQAPLRETVANGFAQIKTKLETMIQDAPARAFDFDED